MSETPPVSRKITPSAVQGKEFPRGVIIGDSIAIGYYDKKWQPLESRLQPIFNPQFVNPPGTFAYEFEKLTHFTWHNQAIGGQTTDELWKRWYRDALAENYDPGDGRGSQTLEKKPDIIILDTGTSELRAADPASIPLIKKNILRMVRTAVENHILVIVITIAPIKTAENAHILEINAWMLDAFREFGDSVRVYDAFTQVSEMGYRNYQLDRNERLVTNVIHFIAGRIYSVLLWLHIVKSAETTPVLKRKYNWGDGCHWSALAVRDVASEIVKQHQDLLLRVQHRNKTFTGDKN